MEHWIIQIRPCRLSKRLCCHGYLYDHLFTIFLLFVKRKHLAIELSWAINLRKEQYKGYFSCLSKVTLRKRLKSLLILILIYVSLCRTGYAFLYSVYSPWTATIIDWKCPKIHIYIIQRREVVFSWYSSFVH